MPAFAKISKAAFREIEESSGILTTYPTGADKKAAKEAHASSSGIPCRTSASMMASAGLNMIATHF